MMLDAQRVRYLCEYPRESSFTTQGVNMWFYFYLNQEYGFALAKLTLLTEF